MRSFGKPTAIGAAIAGPLITPGGYPTLYAATAVVGVLGSVLVWRIKTVAQTFQCYIPGQGTRRCGP